MPERARPGPPAARAPADARTSAHRNARAPRDFVTLGALPRRRHRARCTHITQPNPATRLPRPIHVGQTGRMMTEAEALQTLAREDPAVADDAEGGAALADLRAAASGRSRCCGCRNFSGTCCRPAGRCRATGTRRSRGRSARLLTLAGLERYGDVCASAETERIIAAYAAPSDEGIAAYSKASRLARRTARHRPAGLEIGQGPGGAAAYEACAAADRARHGRRRPAGRRERLEDQAGRARRPLAHPVTDEPGTTPWLAGSAPSASTSGRTATPASAPRWQADRAAPARAAGAARRAAAHACAGCSSTPTPACRLTSRHYIAPARGGAEALGPVRLGGAWCGRRPPGRGKRHQELDVYPLHTLRAPGAARDGRGAAQRHAAWC